MSTTKSPDEAANRLLEHDYFEGETFERLELPSAALSNKEFFRCAFIDCHLQESQWRKSVLEDCEFKGCDLTRAQLREAGLRGVRFVGSKLMGIDWTGVSPNPEVSFVECNLRYTSCSALNLRQTRFERCMMQDANLVEVDLTDSAFPGTDLTSASFSACTLDGADFAEALGLFIDPEFNAVRDARIAVESAVLLAEAKGFIVAGHSVEPARGSGSKRRRR